MKITKIETIPIRLPTRRVHQWASGLDPAANRARGRVYARFLAFSPTTSWPQAAAMSWPLL